MNNSLPFDIDVHTLDARLKAGENLLILDVREKWEVDICSLPSSLHIPLSSLPSNVDQIPQAQLIVTLCHHGGRSAKAALWLQSQGYNKVQNLQGGIDAWARQIDPQIRTY